MNPKDENIPDELLFLVDDTIKRLWGKPMDIHILQSNVLDAMHQFKLKEYYVNNFGLEIGAIDGEEFPIDTHTERWKQLERLAYLREERFEELLNRAKRRGVLKGDPKTIARVI